MNKAKIIAELENMVFARLFGRQPWLADQETCSALHRKLVQIAQFVESLTRWRTPLSEKQRVWPRDIAARLRRAA